MTHLDPSERPTAKQILDEDIFKEFKKKFEAPLFNNGKYQKYNIQSRGQCFAVLDRTNGKKFFSLISD